MSDTSHLIWVSDDLGNVTNFTDAREVASFSRNGLKVNVVLKTNPVLLVQEFPTEAKAIRFANVLAKAKGIKVPE